MQEGRKGVCFATYIQVEFRRLVLDESLDPRDFAGARSLNFPPLKLIPNGNMRNGEGHGQRGGQAGARRPRMAHPAEKAAVETLQISVLVGGCLCPERCPKRRKQQESSTSTSTRELRYGEGAAGNCCKDFEQREEYNHYDEVMSRSRPTNASKAEQAAMRAADRSCLGMGLGGGRRGI